jgi:ribosomal protein L31E
MRSSTSLIGKERYMNNPMILPNVTISKNLYHDGVKPEMVVEHKQLSEILWAVASQNPTWEIRVTMAVGGGSHVRRVNVYQDGERLGEIGFEYSGRSGGNVVYVENERISASRSRGGGKQFSSNNKRLLATVKKYFSRKTVGEKINEALVNCDKMLNSVAWDNAMKENRLKLRVSEHAVSFVTGVGRELYVQHLTTTGNPTVISAIDDLVEAQKMSAASANIKDMFSKQQLTLVLLDNDKYIVKNSETTDTFDADSLPQSLRRSLGMLKLVEKGQIVSNSGMRVEDNVFIVVQDKPE